MSGPPTHTHTPLPCPRPAPRRWRPRLEDPAREPAQVGQPAHRVDLHRRPAGQRGAPALLPLQGGCRRVCRCGGRLRGVLGSVRVVQVRPPGGGRAKARDLPGPSCPPARVHPVAPAPGGRRAPPAPLPSSLASLMLPGLLRALCLDLGSMPAASGCFPPSRPAAAWPLASGAPGGESSAAAPACPPLLQRSRAGTTRWPSTTTPPPSGPSAMWATATSEQGGAGREEQGRELGRCGACARGVLLQCLGPQTLPPAHPPDPLPCWLVMQAPQRSRAVSPGRSPPTCMPLLPFPPRFTPLAASLSSARVCPPAACAASRARSEPQAGASSMHATLHCPLPYTLAPLGRAAFAAPPPWRAAAAEAGTGGLRPPPLAAPHPHPSLPSHPLPRPPVADM